MLVKKVISSDAGIGLDLDVTSSIHNIPRTELPTYCNIGPTPTGNYFII